MKYQLNRLEKRSVVLPIILLITIAGFLQACSGLMPANQQSATITTTETIFQTDSPEPSKTNTSTSTPTKAPNPTITETPTITYTATISLTPTFDFPDGIVIEQSNCRYGPAIAYLFAAGLYAGDKVEIWGRTQSGTWLWVQPEKISYQCWVAASQLNIHGDIFTVWEKTIKLPHSTLYSPVQQVSSHRSGNYVVITWEPVWMTVDDDRGYLIEANLCQGGVISWHAYHADSNSFTLVDEPGCSEPSSALLYVVEKHGYTDPVTIPWP
jgi:hypothetical protein